MGRLSDMCTLITSPRPPPLPHPPPMPQPPPAACVNTCQFSNDGRATTAAQGPSTASAPMAQSALTAVIATSRRRRRCRLSPRRPYPRRHCCHHLRRPRRPLRHHHHLHLHHRHRLHHHQHQCHRHPCSLRALTAAAMLWTATATTAVLAPNMHFVLREVTAQTVGELHHLHRCRLGCQRATFVWRWCL